MLNIGNQTPTVEDLDLWRRRLADKPYRAIREPVRDILIEGDRIFFNVINRKSYRCVYGSEYGGVSVMPSSLR